MLHFCLHSRIYLIIFEGLLLHNFISVLSLMFWMIDSGRGSNLWIHNFINPVTVTKVEIWATHWYWERGWSHGQSLLSNLDSSGSPSGPRSSQHPWDRSPPETQSTSVLASTALTHPAQSYTLIRAKDSSKWPFIAAQWKNTLSAVNSLKESAD